MADLDVKMDDLSLVAEFEESSKAASSSKSKSSKIVDSMELPWLEKYRPQILDDVCGNESTIERLKAIAASGNMPNLILSGPPGTGKTTSIWCLARELLGAEYLKNGVLELNASDERGINAVRGKIKMFAQRKVTLPKGRHKIVILDEADSMTSAAQQALRRTMELYSRTTRFALAANISSKIIEPIQSRCAILRFSRLSADELTTRVLAVLEMEDIKSYTEDGIGALVFIADGDMRNAINAAQATYAGFSVINAENVYRVCDTPHPFALSQIYDAIDDPSSSSEGVSDVSKALKILLSLVKEGYSSLDLIQSMFRVIKARAMNETLKLAWIKSIAFTHARIADGLDSELQLTGLISKLCLDKERIARGEVS